MIYSVSGPKIRPPRPNFHLHGSVFVLLAGLAAQIARLGSISCRLHCVNYLDLVSLSLSLYLSLSLCRPTMSKSEAAACTQSNAV